MKENEITEDETKKKRNDGDSCVLIHKYRNIKPFTTEPSSNRQRIHYQHIFSENNDLEKGRMTFSQLLPAAVLRTFLLWNVRCNSFSLPYSEPGNWKEREIYTY